MILKSHASAKPGKIQDMKKTHARANEVVQHGVGNNVWGGSDG